jgi:hypothetical protein
VCEDAKRCSASKPLLSRALTSESTTAVLSQQVLDNILSRKGKQLEERETVFSRIFVDGPSEKCHTIKLQAVTTWNVEKQKELGVFARENVQYGLFLPPLSLLHSDASGGIKLK